jgi:DnaD/phage-associated family protein
MPFTGFTTDRLVRLPPELFTEVLPQITLPSELKVTLHVFYRISRLRGSAPRRLGWDDLLSDEVLRRSLRAVSKLRPFDDMLSEGLDAAVRRTTLLHIVTPESGRATNWYLINTAANRLWVEQIAAATIQPEPVQAEPEERPSLAAIYEQNIGLITPLLLEELREAEERYPTPWIEDAIREAVRSNARSWRYVRKVLERWAANGRENAANHNERSFDLDKYLGGSYGDLFRRGSDTSDI